MRGSGFVGRTRVAFIAPGERFELGWGAEAGLRVRRQVEEVEEEPRALSGWFVRRVRETVWLSTLDGGARRTAVRLRIPVSELEKVVVLQDEAKTTGGLRADVAGFLRWDIALDASRPRHVVELTYRVKRHKDVVGL